MSAATWLEPVITLHYREDPSYHIADGSAFNGPFHPALGLVPSTAIHQESLHSPDVAQLLQELALIKPLLRSRPPPPSSPDETKLAAFDAYVGTLEGAVAGFVEAFARSSAIDSSAAIWVAGGPPSMTTS